MKISSIAPISVPSSKDGISEVEEVIVGENTESSRGFVVSVSLKNHVLFWHVLN